MTDTVLLTGVTGFIGSHVAAKLLHAGYSVRGTMRNTAKSDNVMAAFKRNGVDTANLDLIQLDLLEDEGWADAVKDCRYIQHIASPFPLSAPADREALVPAARAGAQRVLEHGLSNKVERIVMTSSVVSMVGRPGRPEEVVITEQDWSDPEWKKLTAYPVSKTRAELSAWAYVRKYGEEKTLTVVNPGLVLGPDTFNNAGASLGLVKAMMQGEFPRVPKIGFPIVDVRDVASIHVRAMTAKDAAGRRLIAAANSLWLKDIAGVLKSEFPQFDRLPKSDLPNFLVRIGSLFDDRVKSVLADLGIFHKADNAYVTTITGVLPRPAKEAIISAAQSLIDNGDVKP